MVLKMKNIQYKIILYVKKGFWEKTENNVDYFGEKLYYNLEYICELGKV